CAEGEYDCEDATCIAETLRCNGRVNCKFRWDEDDCKSEVNALGRLLQEEHMVIITHHILHDSNRDVLCLHLQTVPGS
ncbi:neuropilin and tolloid-like protein 2, partial [Homalodisca vitripennis]|uniref:neuropilin and tolloid-like protein 2 n=1 Tax=Homalodisca vitripennis TaxID=197043 RepID=UPI001EE9F010